jgi:hypothetical protein
MSTKSTTHQTIFASRDMSYEERTAIYDTAKRRAHALRREAVSRLIDDMIAWMFHRPRVARRTSPTRKEHLCHS